MQKGFVLILILAVIIGIFAVSNSGLVAIDFVFTEVLLSQAIVIFICVLLGAVIASVISGIRQMALKKEIKHLKEENNKLQAQVHELESKNKEHEKSLLRDQEKDEDLNMFELRKY